MKLTIYKTDGKSSGKKTELSDQIFSIEPNKNVLYEDVRRIQASKRQGTAKTKERGEVRGGGKKAYKQKGTGMARRGSIRSPLLRGGGTVFGPEPRTYNVRLTKKAKKLARKSALSLKASAEEIKIVDDFTFDEPKTKQMVSIIDALGLTDKKVLILMAENDRNVIKSAQNLRKVEVVHASQATTYQFLNSDTVVMLKSAVELLQNSIETKVDEEAA